MGFFSIITLASITQILAILRYNQLNSRHPGSTPGGPGSDQFSEGLDSRFPSITTDSILDNDYGNGPQEQKTYPNNEKLQTT